MGKPTTLNLDIYRGDTYTHELTFTDDSTPPVPLDLSEYTITAQIRDRPENGNLIVAFTVNTTFIEDGKITLELAPEDSYIEPGYWDLQFKNLSWTKTWLSGRVNVYGDVTQEVSP